MEDQPQSRIILPVLVMSLVLFGGVFAAYRSAKSRNSAIVLPGGITYLGPSPSPTPPTSPNPLTSHIPVPADAKWIERRGQTLPYAFKHPESLSLGLFPGDPYDSVTVFYPGTDANTNIFFRVENLTTLGKSEYIGNPMEYAKNWWKDYTWTGVSSVTSFTTESGLTGYRARYLTTENTASYDHIFITVPDRNDLIIWISGKLFTDDVFDRIVDSVTWQN